MDNFFSSHCFFPGCADSKYKSAEKVHDLKIAFKDQAWDGKRVPQRQGSVKTAAVKD